MLIIDKLKDQASFTVTEKRIADYILQNIAEIPHLYIDDLAKLTYTSRSAIIRLSKKLGYNGFRKFRMAISDAVHSQQHVLGSVNANFPFEPQDSPMEIAKKMSDLTIDTIKKTRAQLSDEQLTETVNLLLEAERIFLFSIGDSQLRARSFQNKLTKINKTSIIADEYGDEAWNAVNLTKKDCALFVSYSGKSKQYNKILRYFLEESIPTILLTGNTNSELAKLASLSIIAVQDEYDFVKVGTFSSQVSFEYILDTIFSIMYAKNYKQNLIDFKRKQSVLQLGILKED